jgi:glycosyltransferase involved in cell wall biosynthesis
MAHQKDHQGIDGKRVVAVVPAYNEERDIAGVLRELCSYKGFDEVCVVDDGSTDATSQIAATFPVRLIRHAENQGKGAAMQSGVAASGADIIFFCDADMRGFSHSLLSDVLAPVLAGETDMVIAMRNSRMHYAGYFFSIIPLLGGQRALTRSLWEKVPSEYRDRFMVETALNFYSKYWGNGFQYKVVSGLTQTIKEKKYGFWKGLVARLSMSEEVLIAQVRLQFAEVPMSVRTGRVALTNALGALGAAFLGAIILFAAYSGPADFVRGIYSDALLTDPSTPFVDFLLVLARDLGTNVIAFCGAFLMVANILFALLNLKNIKYLTYGRSRVRRIR